MDQNRFLKYIREESWILFFWDLNNLIKTFFILSAPEHLNLDLIQIISEIFRTKRENCTLTYSSTMDTMRFHQEVREEVRTP